MSSLPGPRRQFETKLTGPRGSGAMTAPDPWLSLQEGGDFGTVVQTVARPAMKILHAADLHLDSPLRGLVEYEGAPIVEVRKASRRALVRLFDEAIARDVDLVLLAGDLYDGDFRDFSTALFFSEQVARLREVGAKLVWLRGNHDAENRFTKHLRLPDYAHELPTHVAGSVVFEELDAVVHGQGYQSRDTTQNLVLDYPAPLEGLFNIGLLHTALEGREGHLPYAPCSVAELAARGYHYWALGHVHQREIVAVDPHIVFPGNLQGRSVRETGPKGCMLVETSGPRVISLEPLMVDHVRWARLEVDLSTSDHLEEALENCAQRLAEEAASTDGRTLACRIRVVGKTLAHRELVHSERFLHELRALGLELGPVYVESVEVRTRGQVELEALLARGDAFAEAMSALARDRRSVERKQELLELLTRDLGALPQELVRQELDELDTTLDEAFQLLEARLVEAQEPSWERS